MTGTAPTPESGNGFRLEEGNRQRVEQIRSRQESRRGFQYYTDIAYLLDLVDVLCSVQPTPESKQEWCVTTAKRAFVNAKAEQYGDANGQR